MSLLNFHQLPASSGGSHLGLQPGAWWYITASHVTLYLKEQLSFVDPGGRFLCAGPLLLFAFLNPPDFAWQAPLTLALCHPRSPPSSRPSCGPVSSNSSLLPADRRLDLV